MKINKLHSTRIFLAGILVLGLALRLVYLREWFHFEMDEEVIAWKLRPFLQEGRPFLIGGGTPFGFHLGPAFYYLSAIPLFFSGLDPVGWGWLAAAAGGATIFMCWLVGKNLYGRRVGLTAALLWAASFTAVMSDRHWWPLVLDPILALLVILCLFKIGKFRKLPLGSLRNRGTKEWAGLGLVLAFAWQTDLTVLPLFLAAAIVAIRNWKTQKRGVAIAVLILLMSVVPLVLFELRHPGANLGRLRSDLLRSDLGRSDLVEAGAFVPAALGRLLFPVSHLDGNLLNFYTWCTAIADGRIAGQPWWASLIVAVLLALPFVISALSWNLCRFPVKHVMTRRSKLFESTSSLADRVLQIVILSGVFGIVLFRLGGGNLYDFYLAILYPVVLLLAARAVDFIWRRGGIVFAAGVVAVIMGLNLTAIARAHHPQGLAIKQAAAAGAAEQLSGKEFELDSLSRCSRYNGARYLFFLENMEPAKSFVDQDLSWLYQSTSKASPPEYWVMFATPGDLTESERQRYNQLVPKSISREKFGELEVIVGREE